MKRKVLRIAGLLSGFLTLSGSVTTRAQEPLAVVNAPAEIGSPGPVRESTPPRRSRMRSSYPRSVRYPSLRLVNATQEPATVGSRPDPALPAGPEPFAETPTPRPPQAPAPVPRGLTAPEPETAVVPDAAPPPVPPAAAPATAPALPPAASLTPPLTSPTTPAPAAPAAGSLLGGTLISGGSALNMIGDQGTISIQPLVGRNSPVSIVRNFALNITDNNSAVLQNRIIPLEFYHFFGARRVYPGLPLDPTNFAAQIFPSQLSSTRVQTNDSRYVFGFETILAKRLSVLVRQAVVTIDRPDVTFQQGIDLHSIGGLRSGWSDLQISPKFLLTQREKFLSTFSMGMVIPIGANSAYNQFGNSAFVFQPSLLFFATPTDRWVLQSGVEYDVPVANNLSGVTLFRWVTFAGYRIYSNRESEILNDIYPVIEFHGSHLVGGFQQNTVNFSAGLRLNVFRRAQIGLGYAVPLTEQKQFNNEFLLNMSIFF